MVQSRQISFSLARELRVEHEMGDDKIWGAFKPDDKTQHLWGLTQTTLRNHGLRTDILYDDAHFPLPGEYRNVYRIETG